MNSKLPLLLALLAFVSAPVVMGVAETKTETKSESKEVEKSSEKAPEKPAEKQAPKKLSSECLVSEEIVHDLELREKALAERESALKEKEKDLQAQAAAIKEEFSKLQGKKAEEQATRQKVLAAREEQVNKLIETFEGMSPKAAAQVLGGVEDELAVLALSRLSTLKAGKILGNLKSDQSARLSEMMAYGRASSRKEAARVDTGK
jgi:flagellar motility protein MotE (MotC chaperone)